MIEHIHDVVLLLVEGPGRWGHAGKLGMQHDVGTVNPVYMCHNGIKRCRGYVLKTQMHLYVFVKQFYRPSQGIGNKDLSGLHYEVATGEVFALPSGRVLSFRAYQLDLSHTFEPADGMSGAELLSLLVLLIARGQTSGIPRDPALCLEEALDPAPALRSRGFELFGVGFDGPPFLQCHPEIPSFGEDRILDSLVVVAGICKNHHIFGIIVLQVEPQIQSLEIFLDSEMFRFVFYFFLLPAILPAMEGDGDKGDDVVFNLNWDLFLPDTSEANSR